MKNMITSIIEGWARWSRGQKLTFMILVLITQYATLLLLIAASVMGQWISSPEGVSFKALLPYSWPVMLGAQVALFVSVFAALEARSILVNRQQK
tara:strand:+ start:196 stop:480 length:285 start_codon:yes stop_codon:yes gene_type:complete